MFNNAEIENILKSANIVDIISSYVPLTPRGKNYFGVCPFHEDTNPSMSVSEEKQIYKCFSCGAAGNVFTFVSEYNNVGFLDAVKIVAEKCGLSFNVQTSTKTKPQTYQKEYEIMDLALKFYQNNLNTPEGLKAKAYLKDRSLDENVIKDFDLGLALNGNYSLHNLLTSKNYDIKTLLDLGLVNRNGSYLNDVFNNRIIFPIHDLEGHPIGFTGRIYESSNQAKYLNSKESIIFKKGQILFNYHRAKNEIKKKKTVIIVEGNMDAIRLYSSGVKNVVALMGTSLTKDQVSILKSLRSKIILMFDNDSAGELATFQNGNILEENGLTPYVVRLSGEKDPDEYIIKNGIQAIINNIENPLSFLDFKLRYFKKDKDLTKTDDLVNYIKEIVNSLAYVTDDLTKDITIKKISDTYDVPLDLIKRELSKVTPKIAKSPPKAPPKLEKKSFSKYDIASTSILYYMMNDGKYIERFKKDLGYFTLKKYRSIANEIIYYYDTYKDIDVSRFVTFVGPKDYIYDDVMNVIKMVNIDTLTMDDFNEYLNVAKLETTKAEIKKLKEEINNTLDEAEKCALAEKLIELKKGCVGNEE